MTQILKWLILCSLCTFSISKSIQTLACQEGFTLLDTGNIQKCLKTSQVPRGHNDAEKDCRSYGGSLVIVNGESENIALVQFLKSSKAHEFWIGAFCFNTSPVICLHDNGDQVIWDNFEYLIEAGCVYLDSNNGDWKLDNGCQEKGGLNRSYVCEAPLTSYDHRNCLHNFNNHCYYPSSEMPPSLQNLPYAQALKVCQTQYSANLSSVHSMEESDFIISLFSDEMVTDIGLGAQSPQPYNYVWADGSVMVYSNFNLLYYPDKGGSCYRLVIDAATGFWMSKTCEGRFQYVCKRSIVPSVKSSSSFQLQENTSYCNKTLISKSVVIGVTSPEVHFECTIDLITTGKYQLGMFFTEINRDVDFQIFDNQGVLIYDNVAQDRPITLIAPSNTATLKYVPSRLYESFYFYLVNV